MAHPLTHLTHGISTRRPFHPAKTACWHKKDGTTSSATKLTAAFNKGAVPADKEQTVVKRPKWLGGSRATKADKQKKSRQQTDQRMKQQEARRGDSKVTRDDPTTKIVLSPDDPMAKASKNTGRIKK